MQTSPRTAVAQKHAGPGADLIRFLAPLLRGRKVALVGAVAPDTILERWGALSVTPLDLTDSLPKGDDLDAVLCFDPRCADQMVQQAASLQQAWPAAWFAALGVTAPVSNGVTARHTAHYLYRPLTGAIVADARFARSRFAALRDADLAAGTPQHLLLWSETPLPGLQPGLFEAGALPATPVTAPVPLPLDGLRPDRPPQTEDGRVLALAERLLRVEDRTLALRGENLRLRAQLAEGPAATAPGAGGGIDAPKTTHPWPVAETPDRLPGTFGSYDRRPDDGAILEAAHGEAFLTQFGLLGDTPDFSGAVDALNAMAPVLRITAQAPDVSIVMPVYGQLAYTLNCLDSLFRQDTRYSAEIIVIDDASADEATRRHLPQVRGIRYHRQPRNGGFIESCNAGGAMAEGRFILMLNNDTRVAKGWLDALIDSFTWFPKAGLVGSKMLQPDGRLLEAGNIVWRDGSVRNYGRDDDPNRPHYCHARQVDYVSGCSIVLPAPLWRQLGGFDPYFAPAYAEDADIAQRVAAEGREVWYQPASRVIHYEGRTAGTSTGSGVKAHQVGNLKKLFLRWRQNFETYRRGGDAPFLERERSVRKRLLVVDAVTPTPNQDAGSVQTMLALRCAQACGYKTSFVPEDNWLFDPDYTPALQREGIECGYAPFEPGFASYIRRYGALFDVILVYRVTVMAKCLPLLRRYAPQAVVLFHLADLHYLRAERQARLEDNTEGLRAAAALKEQELGIVRRADCTITHSTIEAQILATEVPGAPVAVWPLMLDFCGTAVGFRQRADICFLGGYRHPPNVDAVQYFVRDVFPLVKAAMPGIRFIIAGSNPTQDVQDLASEDVIVTGMVDDLRDVLDTARVFVCPLRFGAGAKGKIMSALSYGLPIVSTPTGVEGAGLVDGTHMLTAATPQEMTLAILHLYTDSTLWTKLSRNGQALVREKFSTEMGARKLQDAVGMAYGHSLDPAPDL